MRMQLPVIRYLVLLLALVFSTAPVAADSRSEAKAHYQAGVKAYNAGDYRAAIKEFSAAQELVPADLNNYNLALAYDKLGEPEPAIQYYRAFLDKQPNSDKRAEIEASIKRLDAAAKSAAAKRAAREKEEEAKRLAEAQEAARKAEAEDAARKAEAEDTPKRPYETRRPAGPNGGSDGDGGDVDVGVGSTGTPGGSGTVSTGDAQLDRVARIDVNQIRDQRLGGASSGMIDTRPPAGGPATAPSSGPDDPSNPAANIDVGAHASGSAGMPATANPGTGTAAAQPGADSAAPTAPNDKPAAKPVYKKWWFWAVLAVSAYVVYSIATEDDDNNNRARMLPEVGGNSPAPASGGMTLMRW